MEPNNIARKGDATVRHALREYTAQVHEQLHQHASFAGLLNGTLGLAEYRQLIERLYGFYVPLDRAIERALSQCPVTGPNFSYAKRAQLLGRDLRDLGLSQTALGAVPRCSEADCLVSPATLGGVLYVIEGSTLGGSLINKAAIRLLGRDTENGRRYWSWCRSEQSRRWASINNYLDRLHADGVALKDLSAGAGDTFQLMADWLSPLNRSSMAETGIS